MIDVFNEAELSCKLLHVWLEMSYNSYLIMHMETKKSCVYLRGNAVIGKKCFH